MNNTQPIAMVQQVIAGFVALILGRSVSVQWGNSACMRADGSIMLPRPRVGDAAEVALLTRLAVHEAGHAQHTDVGCFDRLDHQTLVMFNLLEDPRMELRQVQSYPGANLILSRSLDELMALVMSNVGLETEEQRSRLVQMDILVRGMQATTPRPVFETHGATLRELSANILSQEQSEAIDDCVKRIPTLANSQECEELAAELIARLNQPPRQQESQEESPSQSEAGQDQGEPEASDGTPQGSGSDDEPPSGAQDGQTDKPGHEDAGRDDVTGESENESATTPSADATDSDAGPPSVDPNPSGADSDEVTPNEVPSDREDGSNQNSDADSCAGAEDQTSASDGQQGQQGTSAEASDDSENSADAGDTGDSGGDPGNPGAGASEPQDGNVPGSGGHGAQSGQAGDTDQAQATQDSPASPGPLPDLSTSLDLGELLRETLRQAYGEHPDEGEGAEATTEASPEIIEAMEELLEGDPKDLETMLREAAQLIGAAQAAQTGSQAGEQPPQANSNKDQVSVEAELPSKDSSPDADLDLRLQGVESRLVHVLLRELQDRRTRPSRHTRSGGQVAAQRFWRLQRLGDTKVFKSRNTVTGIDAAVTILLDRSGSMFEILETAARSALAFSFALQRLGNVRTSVSMFPAMTAFTEELQGFGRSPREAAMRCESLLALGSTPVAQAILEELPRLLAQRKRRNLMVVITDDGPDSEQLLKAAMREADRQDVEIVGIGIGCDISRYYPLSTSISCVDELPGALEVLFRSHVAQRLAA